MQKCLRSAEKAVQLEGHVTGWHFACTKRRWVAVGFLHKQNMYKNTTRHG